MFEYGPQHSTPVKGQETFLSKTQRPETNEHPSRHGGIPQTDLDSKSLRPDNCKLSQLLDLEHPQLSAKPDCTDSFIDISKISVIENTSNIQSEHNNFIYDTTQDDDNTTVNAIQHLDSSETKSSLHTKQPQVHQNKHSFSHRASPTHDRLTHILLEQPHIFNRHNAGSSFQIGSHCNGALLSDCLSDSDLSKLSMSPKAMYGHMGSSEMSCDKVTLSPSRQRMAKAYHKLRCSSAPRSLLADVNICSSRDYSVPSCSMSDYRRTPAVYIEQDIVNKQRQEIQLLMEELGNRDQELNDLVMSHQKQVKAWESDNEKLVALQSRLSHYEDELKIRENQLKDTLSEMARVTEQREVDALELKQTQNEMIKLAERIMENSSYIKEMEAQNQNLSCSLREFVSARQSFTLREQELRSVIEEKDSSLAIKQKEMDEMVEHIKFLEYQCEELGERNNNTAVESINWRKKYFQVKEEAERLNAECRVKEENVQKMTQQLHESLQQAIALQKALFTSCEREKCKEEVMYSLRKQHKRTMQELQNIRELYDRLTRDTTLYHLSVKDKEVTKDGKKKEDDNFDGKGRRGRGDSGARLEQEVDKRKQDGRRRHDSNMSSHKPKQPDASEHSFLVKETKERKQTKDEKTGEKNAGKLNEKILDKSGEKNAGKSDDRKKNYKDESEVHASEFETVSEDISQKLIQKVIPKPLRNEQQPAAPPKIGHTTMFRNAATITSSTTLFSEEANFHRTRSSKPGAKKNSHTESRRTQMHHTGPENTSKNADFRDSKSLSNSRISTTKSVQSRTTSPVMAHNALNSHDKSVMERPKDKVEGCDSSSDVSHVVSPSRYDDDELTPADSDGMCNELKRGASMIEEEHLDSLSPMETRGLDSRSRTPSNSLVLPKKSSFLRKDKAEYIANEGSASILKHNVKKRAVEFDDIEELTKSVSLEAQSQDVGPESECYSPPSAERRHSSSARGNVYPHNRIYASSNCPGGVRENTSLNNTESTGNKNHSSGKVFGQGRENGSEQELEVTGEDCHRTPCDNIHMKLKAQNVEVCTNQWNTGSCNQCRAQGKSGCGCSVGTRTQTAFGIKATNNFEPDNSKNNMAYSCHGKLASASSKLSFNEIDSLLEYNSSLSKLQSRQLQSAERGTLQMCAPSDEINGPAFHPSNQKAHFASPKTEPCHDQNIISSMCYKNPCDDLPERVSTYLAKHLLVRREMYNNNNSASVDHHLNFDLSSGCEVPKKGSEISRHIEHKPLQNGNGGGDLQYAFFNNKGESPHDAVLFLTRTEEVQDFKVVSDPESTKENQLQKQTHPKTEKGENVYKDASNNNSHSVLSDVEDKDDVIVEGHPFCEPVVGASDLSVKMCSPWLMLERTKNTGQLEDISTNPCTDRINLTEKSHFCPEKSVAESKVARNCEPELSYVKKKEDTAFSLAISVPTCTVTGSSLSYREPSLYKHLAHIHFSEKTRRYEWTAQPVIVDPNRESTIWLRVGSHNNILVSQGSSNIKLNELSHAACGGSQDSVVPDGTDIKSDSQFSDSGQFSISGVSSVRVSHNEKSVSHNTQRRENDSPNVRCDSSVNSPKTCSEMAKEHIAGITNKGSQQSKDIHYKSHNNNCYDSTCLNQRNCFPIEICTVSPIPHVPSNFFDPVVKRLEFSDTALEESIAETSDLKMNHSAQHCFPSCGNDKEKIPVRDSSGVSPSDTLGGAFEARVGRGALGAHNSVRCDSQIRCGDNKHDSLPMERRDFNTWHATTNKSLKISSLMNTSAVDEVECNVRLMMESNGHSDLPKNLLGRSTYLVHLSDDEEAELLSVKSKESMNKLQRNNDDQAEARDSHSERKLLHISNISITDYSDIRGVVDGYNSFHNMHHGHLETDGCCEQSLYTKDIPILRRESKNACVIKTFDPGTLFSATDNRQEPSDFSLSPSCVQYDSIVFQKQPENCLDDTRDSSASTACKTRDTCGSSSWVYENSVEEIADKFDDTLSVFLEDPTHDSEAFMGTSMSPVTRLYKLLVESQEIIKSLEESSVKPKAVNSEILLTSSQ